MVPYNVILCRILFCRRVFAHNCNNLQNSVLVGSYFLNIEENLINSRNYKKVIIVAKKKKK